MVAREKLRFGPGGLPTREDVTAAVDLLVARGYSACELDLEGGFWLEPSAAERLGEVAQAVDVSLSVHAPLPAFLGHLERNMKHKRALGMLDHTAGLARLCGAALVVIHPGFLLGRTREKAVEAVVEHLDELRSRLEAKGRLIPFGIEMMGRVRDLGNADDVFRICEQAGWVRPVIDVAHLHAVSDGGFTQPQHFEAVLSRADQLLPDGAPFHIHFSDVAFANRNETRHLNYGAGSLRAEPLAAALVRFERPAVVISESPDEDSHQAIRAALSEGRRQQG